MRLIAVGRLKAGPEADLFSRYNKRLRPALSVTELADGHGAPAEIKRREADAILAILATPDFVVALDQDAPLLSSTDLAQRLDTWRSGGRNLTFLIGGAEGFAKTVLDRAQAILSLGPLTWPHMLVRVMLAEQLYRAQTIQSGHPYHRTGRP